jgi:hypothetical protein
VQVKFQTEVRGRGMAPRDDRPPDSENETQRFRSDEGGEKKERG